MMAAAKEKYFSLERMQAVHLQEAVAESGAALPTLLEQLQHPDPKRLAKLEQILFEAENNKAVIELAHQLSSPELCHLFPLLLRHSDSEDKEDSRFQNRVDLVLRERACPSLYRSAFLAYQTSYERDEVRKHFSLLCSILKIRQESGLGPSWPIFSDFVAPDNRQIVRKILQLLTKQKASLQNFVMTYGILAELPLGQQLLAQAALKASDTLFFDSKELFAQALQTVDAKQQSLLLKRFLSYKSLPPATWNAYCQTIYRELGQPAPEHPVWSQIRASQRQIFGDWVTAATIGTHCRATPDKARVYLRYAVHVQKLEFYDEETLILHFPGFRIVDHQREPEMAVFYDEPQATRRIDSGKTHPASEIVPRRRVDEAIRRGRCRGIIGLPFDEDGMRFTQIFFDLCMKEKVFTQQNLVERWQAQKRSRFFLPGE